MTGFVAGRLWRNFARATTVRFVADRIAVSALDRTLGGLASVLAPCGSFGRALGTARLLIVVIRRMADDPAELRAKILRFREVLRQVDDPILRAAIEELIRLAKEKLNGHDTEP